MCVIELPQPIKEKGVYKDLGGVLIYSVDAKLKSGNNPMVVYPKSTTLDAPFQLGDRFEHKDAPMTVKVLKALSNGRYQIEVTVK